MKYQPALDGFRGLCVGAVFLCHAQLLACGWMGVQAFFVLSGYLITGVLLEAKGHGDRAPAFFKGFYARRVLRIFPAYFGYLAAVLILAGLFGGNLASATRAHWLQHAPYLFTYTYNFYRITAGPGSPFFGHLWSLSIEEQFYLIWPICVFLLAKPGLARLCLWLAITGPVVRLLEVFWLAGHDPDAISHGGHFVYFLTTSQFDAFALGALLNFRTDDVRVERLIGIASKWALPIFILASALLTCIARLSHAGIELTALGWPIYLQFFHAYIWGYTLLNVLFLVALANIDRVPLVGRWWLQRLGRISYGFYIFHLPILWLAFQFTGAQRGSFTVANSVAIVGAFIVTLAVSELSFRFLESPFLRLKRYFAGGGRSDAERAAGAEQLPD